MARRGHCNKIYCDNATNFVGASNQLSEIRNILHTDKAKERILNECASKNIAFEFIPPRAPHFGGLWEAAKHLLQSSLSAANLTGEEIQTVQGKVAEIQRSVVSVGSVQKTDEPNADVEAKQRQMETDGAGAEVLTKQQQIEQELMFQNNKQIQMEEVIVRLQNEVDVLKAQFGLLQAAGVPNSTARRFKLDMLDGVCSKFSGAPEENINIWLRELEKALALFNCDEAEKIIALRAMLSGVARRFAEIKGIYNYELLEECLVGEYGSNLTNARIYKQLAGRQLKPGESVKQYIMEMEHMASYGEVPETELVDFIIQGLKSKTEIGAAGLTVSTLDGLKQLANRFEVRSGVAQVVKNTRASQQMESARSNQQMDSIRCYNCFKYGHYQGECDMPKRPPNSCFVCAEVGHECPKRRGDRSVESGAIASTDEKEIKSFNNVSISFCNYHGCLTKVVLNALFDTGSPVSFVQESCVWRVRDLIQEKQKSKFKGLGNKSVEVSRSIEGLVEFRGDRCKHSFYILKDEQAIFPVVVGRDLLSKFNIVLQKVTKVKYSTDEMKKMNHNFKFKCNISKELDICKKEVEVIVEQKLKQDSKQCSIKESRHKEMSPVDCYVISEDVREKARNAKEGDLFTKKEMLGVDNSRKEMDSNCDLVCEELDVNPELEAGERNALRKLIEQWYVPSKNNSAKLKECAMKIKLTDDRPVYSCPRRLSFKQKQEVQSIIDDLLKQGIIRPSRSPYASPIVLTVKKNGKTRMCVDYRALNLKIVRDNFPLPLIEDCLSYLSGKKFFSTLDLKNGFHQVPIDEESIPITAFVTPMGQYEYCYVPFGLANSPPVFQRCMSVVLKSLIDNGDIMVYLDDIIVATDSMEEQMRVLKQVLQLLSEVGFILNFEKCKFGFTELQYLGYRVNRWGVRPNEDHLRAISEYPVPKNTVEVQKAIGLFSYFRRFVPGFSCIAAPLHQLVRKNVVFEWTEECQKAFTNLKQMLTEAPVLSIFDPGRETELHTDASSKGYGAVLLQKQDDQKFHPVAYFSKTTTDAESRYHSFELETLAIVNALDRFRQFLDGITFTIVTDCNSLVLTLEKKLINPRIARWTLELVDFDFKVRHRKGDQMQHVDALSRLPIVGAVEESEVDVNIQVVQSQDDTVVKLRQKLEEEEVSGFTLENGLVFRVGKDNSQLYVPKAMEKSVIQMVHENYGHQGVDKCVNQIQKHYWFPSMREKVNVFIKNCLKCIYYQGLARGNQRNLFNIEKKSVPFDTVHIDHFGPLEGVESKHRHILTVVDSFTKFVKLYAVNTGAKESICSLKKYFSSYSRPRRIISDRGSCFTSAEFKKFCEENNILHVLNSVASPQSNGQVERVNRVIKSMLAKVTEPWSHSDWSSKLVDVEFAINNTVHTAIRDTPSKVLFGVEQRGRVVDELTEYLEDKYARDIVRLAERRKEAAEAIEKAQRINQRYFEKSHTEAKQFKVGDLVVIKNTDTTVGKNKKLIAKYKGPYVVRKQLGHDRYVVTDVENCQVTQMPYNGVIDSTRMKKWLSTVVDENHDFTEGNTDEHINDEIMNDTEDEYTDYEFLVESDDECANRGRLDVRSAEL